MKNLIQFNSQIHFESYVKEHAAFILSMGFDERTNTGNIQWNELLLATK